MVGYPFTPGLHTAAPAVSQRRLTDAVREEGGRMFVQLQHCGRVCHPDLLNGQVPLAPSALTPAGQAVTYTGPQDFVTPRALERDEGPGIVAQFRRPAEPARQAGFDGIEENPTCSPSPPPATAGPHHGPQARPPRRRMAPLPPADLPARRSATSGADLPHQRGRQRDLPPRGRPARHASWQDKPSALRSVAGHHEVRRLDFAEEAQRWIRASTASARHRTKRLPSDHLADHGERLRVVRAVLRATGRACPACRPPPWARRMGRAAGWWLARPAGGSPLFDARTGQFPWGVSRLGVWAVTGRRGGHAGNRRSARHGCNDGGTGVAQAGTRSSARQDPRLGTVEHQPRTRTKAHFLRRTLS
ncbi:hypothetical protein [Streptomyces sp. RerS4]|uniref:oxidoreductase n=1 Tax=Streptomyces sp. RerS4 TaxID=2942449 RepID=UPI00201C9D60|nr:hypothetical protein [Streptomyces sp. RerS4]UQX04617.1 hypothetical protein M4D82_31965 [Streptomyces sp. RerS4]